MSKKSPLPLRVSAPPREQDNQDAQPGLVPKLRFPEFQEAGTWRSSPIGKKIELLTGYPFDGKDITEDSSGIRLLRGINITEGTIRHSKEIDRYYIGDPECLQRFRLCVNDLVIGMDGSKVGKNSALISEFDADTLLVQRVARLRSTDSTLIEFVFQQINSPSFHAYVDRINTSSGIPHISAKQISDFTISFPSLTEQQKIADCLSSLDELIGALGRKLEALRTYKKGLMQQLFPREGETQPRLRFPEFQDAGDWECRTLGDVAEISSGSTPLRSNSDFYANGTVPWIKTTDLNNSLITHTEEKISVKAKARINPVGSVLVAMYGGFNQIGRTGCLTFPAATNQALSVLVLNQEIALPSFVLAWLNARVGDWKRIASSSRKDPNITGSDVDRFPIVLPTLPEQQRIASCLSSLDDLITAEVQKLEALKTHKRGLMQQLFPSPEDS